ncbi:glycosyltransferase 87 family protein [Streptomyces sp. NBC_00259]|uniref:glycosyltransferase 87 family protein n=1 Tax=Streptomyces sp. NBC_00259 TaxID=2903643 RepID=UPI002E2891A3|nr:glycosyltransferase 87 family protein [Streptomyces sp. NBC_00259]
MIAPRTLSTGLLLCALTTALALTVRKDGYYSDPVGLAWWYGACWVLFAAAVWCLRKVPVRHAVALVLGGSVVVAATGLLAPPRTSSDAYRYAWDGRVQAAGISPYDHAPADPALVALRDPWLFPAGAGCRGPERARIPGPEGVVHCTRLNRPAVHTIYPPVAEGYFLLVHSLSPDGSRHKPLQAGGALLSVGVTGALLLVLRRRGGGSCDTGGDVRGDGTGEGSDGVRGAAYWAWCPAVPLEAVNNAHADVLGVLLGVAGLGLVVRHRAAGGALLGAATATKLLPAVLLPGALSGVRRWRDAAAVVLPAVAVVVLAYLPYVLVSEGSVLGYLTGYVEEEGYGDASARSRYALLRLVLPDGWAAPAVAVLMLCAVAYVLLRGDPRRPWRGALLVTGTAFLLLTPGYSWYALLLVALVALDGRWEWLGVAMAGAAKYVTGQSGGDPYVITATAYAIAAGAVLAGCALRRVRRSPGHEGAAAHASGPADPVADAATRDRRP